MLNPVLIGSAAFIISMLLIKLCDKSSPKVRALPTDPCSTPHANGFVLRSYKQPFGYSQEELQDRTAAAYNSRMAPTIIY